MYGLMGLAALLIAWACVSARAAHYNITIPIGLMVAGLALAGGDNPLMVVDFSSSEVQHLLQATLALILFADATEISLRRMRSAGRLLARLLLVAFPLTVIA